MVKFLKQIANNIKREVQVYQRVLVDPDTPWLARMLLGLAVSYLLLPFDLIPDFIPVIGQLDDLVIIPALVWLALRIIPEEVVEQARQAVGEELSEL